MSDQIYDIIEKEGCKVVIYYDEHPPNPREWDNLGKMVCFHHRYLLGDEHGYSSPEELLRDLETGRYYYLPLYLYDHSGLRMRIHPFHCPWDSEQVGYIMVEKEKARKEAPKGENVEKWALRVLEAEVKVYDQYLAGDVYGWVLFDSDGIEVDSCWGYFEKEHVMSEAEEELDGFIRRLRETAKEKVRSATEWLLRAGLMGTEKVDQALDFLASVEESGEIEHFRSKLKDTGFLRGAAASHLMSLFRLSREDAEAVIDLFLWKEGVSNG